MIIYHTTSNALIYTYLLYISNDIEYRINN